MEFEPWYREVVNGMAEHVGGILAVTERVKEAHARGYTPAEFINETLIEIEQAQEEYSEIEAEEE